LRVEDTRGKCETVVFPEVFSKVERSIKAGAVVFIRGKISIRGASPNIMVDDLDDVSAIYASVRSIRIDMTKAEPSRLETVKKRLERFPGTVPVHLQIDTKNLRSVEIKVRQDLYVTPSEVLMEEIKAIVGESFRFLL